MVVIGCRFIFHYKLEPDKQRARDQFSAWEKINAVSQKCFSVYLIAVIVIQWYRFFFYITFSDGFVRVQRFLLVLVKHSVFPSVCPA